MKAKKTPIAILLMLLFAVSFYFSGFSAEFTYKEFTASTFVPHYLTLYSLASAPSLLLALIVALWVFALLSFVNRQPNVGFLFMTIILVLYIAFLVSYRQEVRNNSVYNTLNAQFTENSIKVKKRDFFITMTPNFWCYITAALAAATVAVTLPDFRTQSTRYRLKTQLEPYVFIAPHIIIFVLFSMVPIIYGLYAAFTTWDLYNDPVFSGFKNFQTILFDSENTYYGQLRKGLWNTVKFMLYTTPFCIIVPFSIAMATRYVTRSSKVLQAVYYLPSLLSTTTVMLAWKYFFNNTYGMAVNLFGWTWNWFAPPYTWVMMVIITTWWCTGGTMVIYQSALASVPAEQYEAAAIDGAGAWNKFRYITIPNMSYPLMYTCVTTVIAQLNVYGQPNLLTGYNYNGANAVLLMYIRDTAFTQNIAGIASAMSLILGAVIMSISFIQIRVMRGDSERAKRAAR